MAMSDEVAVRQPPQDIEAERMLLGSILLDPVAIEPLIRDGVAGEPFAGHFYREYHRKIFEAMVAVRAAGVELDIFSLARELGEKKRDAHYIAELIDSVRTSSDAMTYANTVRRRSRARQVAILAADIFELSYASAQDISAEGVLALKKLRMSMRQNAGA